MWQNGSIMSTLFDDQDRQQVLDRIHRLKSDSSPLWGSMTVTKAACHMGDQLAMALGEIEVRSSWRPEGLPLIREFIIYVMPWPKGVATAPELLQTDLAELDEARGRLTDLIDRFVERGANGRLVPHSLFGKISNKTWGYLALRHLDHHLRQFNV